MAAESGPQDSVRAFDQVVRWLYAAGITFSLPITWMSVGASGSHLATLVTVGMVAAGSAIYCVLRGFTLVTAVAIATALLLIQVGSPAGDQVVPIMIAVFSSYIALSGAALSSGVAVLLFNLAVVAVIFAKGDERGVTIALVESMGRLAIALAVVICVRGGRRAAAELDRQAARWAAQRRVEFGALAHEAQASWVDHFLHDGVVHALRAVALGQRLSRREVQSTAETVVSDLAWLGGANSGAPGLRAELEQSVRDLELGIRWHVDEMNAPAAVREALCQAIRESLRNVRLHSGTVTADVTVRCTGRGLRATVRDRGGGFDSTRLPEGHFGVRDGIVGRFADIGGTARVRSDANGTTVKLHWSPRRSSGDWHGAFGVRSLAGDAGAPFVALNIVQMVLMALSLTKPVFAVGATVVTSVAWMWARLMTRRRNLGPGESFALQAIGAAAAIAAGLSVSDSFEPSTYWLAGGTIVLSLFAILARPLKETAPWAAVLLAAPTLLLVWRGAELADLRRMAPALGMPVVGVAMAYLVRVLLQRLGRHNEQRMEAERESLERVEESSARQKLLAERVTDLNGRIAPFLAEVAIGRLDPRDLEVQRVAAVYEARVRDVLGGGVSAWPAELIGIVDDLRVRGASLSLARYVDGAENQLGLVRSVLSSLEPMDVSGVQVRVSWTPRPSGSLVAVNVTPYLARVERCLLGRLQSGSSVQTDHRSYLRFSLEEGTVLSTNRGPENPGHATFRELAKIER